MDKIECPKCHHKFELTDSLAGPLIAAARFEADADATARIAAAKKVIEVEAAKKAQATAAEAIAKAQLDSSNSNLAAAEAEARLKAALGKLGSAQAEQATLVRKQREFEDAKRELDLTIERRVSEGVREARAQAEQSAQDTIGLKLKEREMTISSLQETIEELKRKSERGSEQMQGEAAELVLETALPERFPVDSIEPVPKGVHGGDVLQRVVGPTGRACGSILFELKRTKNWKDEWLSKLRGDQRATKADAAVIISSALPDGVTTFDCREGVWVTSSRTAIPLVMAIRQSLIELTAARTASEGQETKTEMVYQYLMGPRFKQRVQAIVEAFSNMKEELAQEKRILTKVWARRDEQIDRAIQSTVGMHGDLQGIAGKSLQEIEGLELPALEDKKS